MGLALPPEKELVNKESIRLAAFNDFLLSSRGGSWTAPPHAEAGPDPKRVLAEIGKARKLISTVYSSDTPSVWKDPRLSLLLPFWRSTLGTIGGVLYIWRRPLEVAQSLAVMSGLTLSHGLAMWEWYNHQAMLGMVGLPVFASSYETLLERTDQLGQEIAVWLGEHVGVEATGASIEGAIKRSLRHHHSVERPGRLLGEQRALTDVLESLQGQHASFRAPALPQLSPWTLDLLTARREFERALPWEASARRAIRNMFHKLFSDSTRRHRRAR